MIIKNSKFIRLPRFSGDLILKKAMLREGNAGIELTCQLKGGPDQSGQVLLLIEDRDKKYKLFSWLLKQQGKDIETIYNSDFDFR